MSVGYCCQTIRQHDSLIFKGGDVQWTDHEIWDYHADSKCQAPTAQRCDAISQKTSTALLSTTKHLHIVQHHQDPSEMLLQFLTTHSTTDFSITSLWVCNILTEYTTLEKKSPVRSTRPYVNSSNHSVSISQFITTLNKQNNFFMSVNNVVRHCYTSRELKTNYSIIYEIKWALFLLIYCKYSFLSLCLFFVIMALTQLAPASHFTGAK
jgi:hypothetical protein